MIGEAVSLFKCTKLSDHWVEIGSLKYDLGLHLIQSEIHQQYTCLWPVDQWYSRQDITHNI